MTAVTRPAISEHPAGRGRGRISLGVISVSLLALLVVGAAGLYGRLLYRCATWADAGLAAEPENQPVIIIRNLARLVSEPVCEGRLNARIWAQLGAAYQHVPAVEALNQRRSLGAYQQASLLEPEQADLLLALAEAFVNVGQFNYALRPTSEAFRVRTDDARALRLLVTTYIAIEDRPAAIERLVETFGDGTTLPLWAQIAAETLLFPAIDEENEALLPLVNREITGPDAQFNQQVGQAFRLGLQGDDAAMRDALAAIPLSDAAFGDLLDAVKLYEQLGLTDQIIDALRRKQGAERLNRQEKLRFMRALWLAQEHGEIVTRFADDVRLQRFQPEAGLIVTLSAHELGKASHFAKILHETGDRHSQWDTTLMGLQQALNNPDGVYAEELLDHAMAAREFMPHSGVLSIMMAAIWQALEEPEMIQNNLEAARLVMGAPLTALDRIPQPSLKIRPDPAREALNRCSATNLDAIDGTPAPPATIVACWDGLITEFPSSMLVLRAALSDPRIDEEKDKRASYLTILEQNSPRQAAFWRRAKARDLLSGAPTQQAASEALLLLRPLLQQPQPRADTLLLTAAAYGALRDTSRTFQHLSETILLQPNYAPAVHGLSLDIYQDQPTLLPRTLIQWWEVFAVLEAQAIFGGHNKADTRQLIGDVLQRRYDALRDWAGQQADERLLVALSFVADKTEKRPSEGEAADANPDE